MSLTVSSRRVSHVGSDQGREAAHLRNVLDKADKAGLVKELSTKPTAAELKGARQVKLFQGVDAAEIAYVLKDKMYVENWAVMPSMQHWSEVPLHVKPTKQVDITKGAELKAVQAKVERAFKHGLPAPVSAPMNPERFQNVDVTPRFLMGAGWRAYNINGELMVKITPVTMNPPKSTWYDLGKVPAAR